ncbi:TMEM175 family protein [Pseudonocardia ailaonensis]|uniref:TMEM175 family protein n=1 Tax=Pseudonocardia ailaonensis TaxID=367279 RepID=A0ABN2MQ92_9PSEU
MDSTEDDESRADGAPVADNSLGRLLALADGVFAIAMTLLALDLRVPQLPDGATEAQLLAALRDELPSVGTYLLSFYVVANYWLGHHRLMRSVTRTHPRLIVHTLALLLLVAALPFPSSLLAEYGSRPIALVIYAGVNIVASLVILSLRRDLRAYELRSGPTDRSSWFESGLEVRGNLAVFALCIPVAYLVPSWAPFTLVLLAVAGRLGAVARWWRRRRQ